MNESPAPTVSATSTRGVGIYDRVSGANTELPAAPQVRITIRNPYLSSSVRHCSRAASPPSEHAADHGQFFVVYLQDVALPQRLFDHLLRVEVLPQVDVEDLVLSLAVGHRFQETPDRAVRYGAALCQRPEAGCTGVPGELLDLRGERYVVPGYACPDLVAGDAAPSSVTSTVPVGNGTVSSICPTPFSRSWLRSSRPASSSPTALTAQLRSPNCDMW